MSEDIERVLSILVKRDSLQNGVTISYLSNRLGLDRARVEKIVELLYRSGYVQVQQLDRVALITPTLAGYEKAAALRRQKKPQPETQPTSPLIYVAAAGLLVIFLGFLGWWFGLFSQADASEYSSRALLNQENIIRWIDAFGQELDNFRRLVQRGDREAIESYYQAEMEARLQWLQDRATQNWGDLPEKTEIPNSGEMFSQMLFGGLGRRRTRE